MAWYQHCQNCKPISTKSAPASKIAQTKGTLTGMDPQYLSGVALNDPRNGINWFEPWKFGLTYVINIHYIIVSLFIWYLTSLLAVSPRLCPRTFFGRWVDQCQWSTWFATVDSMLPKSCTTMSRNIDCRDPVSVSCFFLMTRKPCRISFKCRNVYNELK